MSDLWQQRLKTCIAATVALQVVLLFLFWAHLFRAETYSYTVPQVVMGVFLFQLAFQSASANERNLAALAVLVVNFELAAFLKLTVDNTWNSFGIAGAITAICFLVLAVRSRA